MSEHAFYIPELNRIIIISFPFNAFTSVEDSKTLVYLGEV